MHISELAQHHVENPREVVSQAQDVKVLILEVDAERRRLSLSMKRVEGQEDGPPGGGDPELRQPEMALGLSEEVFAEGSAAPALDAPEETPELEAAPEADVEAEAEAEAVPAAEAEAPAAEPAEPTSEQEPEPAA